MVDRVNIMRRLKSFVKHDIVILPYKNPKALPAFQQYIFDILKLFLGR